MASTCLRVFFTDDRFHISVTTWTNNTLESWNTLCVLYTQAMSHPASPSLPVCDDGVADIEDCTSGVHFVRLSDKIRAENKVLPRALRRKLSEVTSPVAVGDSFIPGTQSIYVKTWGCSHNNSDGEYMAGLLGASGYTITGNLHCVLSYPIAGICWV